MAQEEAAGGCCGCGCLIFILALMGGCVESCGDYDSYSSSSYTIAVRAEIFPALGRIANFLSNAIWEILAFRPRRLISHLRARRNTSNI